MKLAFCCCALLLVGVAAESGSGTRVNFEPTADFERATGKVLHFIEDAWGGFKRGVAGGGGKDCASDSDCSPVLGRCDRTKSVPSCEPTPLAYWLILMATLGCLVVFVFPVTDDREDHCS